MAARTPPHSGEPPSTATRGVDGANSAKIMRAGAKAEDATGTDDPSWQRPRRPAAAPVVSSRSARGMAFGIIIPVHDEEELLPAALDAIERAIDRAAWAGPAHTVVVLDGCEDASRAIAGRWRRRVGSAAATVVEIDVRNVGAARRAGTDAVLRLRRGNSVNGLWLASTDADSRVHPDWLTHQAVGHAAGAALWSGRVSVDDWDERPVHLAGTWASAYDSEETPVHGASLGVSATSYLAAGGFSPLRTGEDRALWHAVLAGGAAAYHDPDVAVITSARRQGRAPLGFAHALSVMERPGPREPDPGRLLGSQPPERPRRNNGRGRR